MKLLELLNPLNLLDQNPFEAATQLGEDFGNRLFTKKPVLADREAHAIRQRIEPPTRPSNLTLSELNNYIRGESLANPIQVIIDKSFAYDVFSSSFYDDLSGHGFKAGQLSDPYTGDIFTFNTREEFVEALSKLEENRKNYLKERVRNDLLLASGGAPDSIKSIYEATSPIVNGKLVVEDPSSDYYKDMQGDIADAVRARASSMALAELRSWASQVPGLGAILQSRETKIRKAGLSILSSDTITGDDVEKILTAKRTRAHNLNERSDNLDFRIEEMRSLLEKNDIEGLRNKLDWFPTINLA